MSNIPNRSQCQCECHRPGAVSKHVVACCRPDRPSPPVPEADYTDRVKRDAAGVRAHAFGPGSKPSREHAQSVIKLLDETIKDYSDNEVLAFWVLYTELKGENSPNSNLEVLRLTHGRAQLHTRVMRLFVPDFTFGPSDSQA